MKTQEFDPRLIARLGHLIRETRKAAGFTQAQVALALNTSQALVSAWEQGKVAPQAINIYQLKRLLGVSSDLFDPLEDFTGAEIKGMPKDIANAINVKDIEKIGKQLQRLAQKIEKQLQQNQ